MTTSPSRRLVRAWLLASTMFALVSCSGSKSTPAAATVHPSTEAGTADSSTARPPATQSTTAIAAPVPTSQVLAAVATAQTIQRLPFSPSKLEAYANDARAAWAIPGCSPADTATSLPNVSDCTFGPKSATHTMMLIGDSHASMWLPAFELTAERIGWQVIDLTKDNCGPADLHYYLYPLKRPYTECDTWQQWRTTEVNKVKPSIVVLTGFIGNNTGPTAHMTAADWQAGIQRTVKLYTTGIHVVVLGDTPHIPSPGPECLAKNVSNIQVCSSPATQAVPTAFNTAEASAAAATGATYLDVTPWFCAKTCPEVIAGIDVYAGQYHITHDYASYLSGAVQSALGPMIATGSQ